MPAPAGRDPGEPRGLLQRATSLAQEAAETYRHSSRFSRMRGAIVGAWILLAATTMWGACPSSGPANSLGADVQILRDSLVGGQQLMVRNESPEIWTRVRLTLDGGWRHERNTLRPHDQLVLSMPQFQRDGEAAPPDLKPRSLLVECEQGTFSLDLK